MRPALESEGPAAAVDRKGDVCCLLTSRLNARPMPSTSMNEAFIAVDHGWRVVLVNRKQESLFRRPRNETLGRVLWDVLPGPTKSAFSARSAAPRARGVVVEFEEYYGPLDRLAGRPGMPARPGRRHLLARRHRATAFRRRSSGDAAARRGARDRRPRSPQSSQYDSSVVEGRARHGRAEPPEAYRDDRARLRAHGEADRRPPRRHGHRVRHPDHRPRAGERVRAPVGGRSTPTLPPAPRSGSSSASDCEGELPEVAADFQRLLQILGNLVGNAIKFTPAGRADRRRVPCTRPITSGSGSPTPVRAFRRNRSLTSSRNSAAAAPAIRTAPDWGWPSARRSSTRTAVESGPIAGARGGPRS